jgi:hypothetical protein
MNRRTLRKFALVIAAFALASASVFAVSVKQIQPPAPTPVFPPTAPVVIAVLADHYAAGEETEFNHDVENFFKYGLLVDGYYKQKLGDLQVYTYFDATTSGESSYGFRIGANAGNCAVGDSPDTASKIQNVVGGVNPVHTIVIGNHPYEIGCTKGTWTYVAVDAVGTDVLQHELGHALGELFDEWAMASKGSTPHGPFTPGKDRLNCAVTPPPPAHWMPKFPDATNEAECDLHANGVIHPYHDCRMGKTHHTAFCKVCAKLMDDSFDYFRNPEGGGVLNSRITNPNPLNANPHVAAPQPQFGFVNAAFFAQQSRVPPPAPQPRPLVRVLAEFNPTARTVTPKSQTFATAVYVPSYRRLGQYVYEVLDGTNTLEVGVIPDHLFESRAYGGGTQHGTSAQQTVEVVITVPDEDAKTLAAPNRRLRVIMYRISDGSPVRFINRQAFAAMKKTNEVVSLAEMSLSGPSPAQRK